MNLKLQALKSNMKLALDADADFMHLDLRDKKGDAHETRQQTLKEKQRHPHPWR